MNHVILWLTDAEYLMLERKSDATSTMVLQTARLRAENSQAFPRFCGLCLKSAESCRCAADEARARSLTGREEQDR